MRTHVFAPARIQEIISGELFMYWFRARGYSQNPWKHAHWAKILRLLSGPIARDIAILSLRYPISRDTLLGEVSTAPKWCDTPPPPWHLVSHRHICAIPHLATYRAIIVRYPTKTSTKEFCDTIAASIARYEKYRCWASKFACGQGRFPFSSGTLL